MSPAGLFPKVTSKITIIVKKVEMVMATPCVALIVTLFLDQIGKNMDTALSVAIAEIIATFT